MIIDFDAFMMAVFTFSQNISFFNEIIRSAFTLLIGLVFEKLQEKKQLLISHPTCTYVNRNQIKPKLWYARTQNANLLVNIMISYCFFDIKVVIIFGYTCDVSNEAFQSHAGDHINLIIGLEHESGVITISYCLGRFQNVKNYIQIMKLTVIMCKMFIFSLIVHWLI
jgi:hypothetical protein